MAVVGEVDHMTWPTLVTILGVWAIGTFVLAVVVGAVLRWGIHDDVSAGTE